MQKSNKIRHFSEIAFTLKTIFHQPLLTLTEKNLLNKSRENGVLLIKGERV